MAGTTVFKVVLSHCNHNNPEAVAGYCKDGTPIRAKDITKYRLDPSKSKGITRAGYNEIVIQVIHLNTYFETKRGIARRALHNLYCAGAAHGVTIICGDMSGAAYPSSTGPQENLSQRESVQNMQSPMCAEELQYVVDTFNKYKPLSQRIGLQFRHSMRLSTTHHQNSPVYSIYMALIFQNGMTPR